MLTEHWIGRWRDTVAPTARSGGGLRAELHGPGAAAVLRASGMQDSTRGVAGEKNKGSEGSKIPRRRVIAREWTHRRGWLRVEIMARAWRNLGAEVPRMVTGPWRSCGAASGGLRCGRAAWPRRRRGAARGEATRGGALGLGWLVILILNSCHYQS